MRTQAAEVADDPLRVSTDQVKVYVGHLRRKIDTELIETVRGFGYRYRPES